MRFDLDRFHCIMNLILLLPFFGDTQVVTVFKAKLKSNSSNNNYL
jgi:hypothetical protein